MSETAERATNTRESLIATAATLFAEQGITGVSLREILRASGVRNTTALQYHFGDRAGLLRAILDKHNSAVEVARHTLMDAYEAGGNADIRALVAALVRPLSAKLDGADGGREYLQILGELANHPRPELPTDDLESNDSLLRWRSLIGPLLEPEAVRMHRRFVAIRFTFIELGRRAQSGPHTDDRLFISHLIDLVVAVLVAPLSPETLRLETERNALQDN
ncbi:TetR/AcrR family transcriptional regulator [Smaragdicoccus niigatensis]|uniref:TetR/AcrR family transcriptional regulator n=1 Tax=Smaragdicoccus niigatensis TaxID=359359 RepID=UPI000379DB14|nr:helix-turn-helix domain-containing protein [Smaragdicoccus niigatensis]